MKWYIILLTAFFLQCKSSKKSSETSQIKFETQSEISVSAPYYTKWAAGEQSGGTGYSVFFPNLINKNNYVIDSVFFRNLKGKIIVGKASYFTSLQDKSKDLIMSNEPNAEYGNTLPNNSEKFPFQLKDDECVISYIANGKTKYYKMDNLVEKPSEYLPNEAPKQNKE